jgi:hypothetical protein
MKWKKQNHEFLPEITLSVGFLVFLNGILFEFSKPINLNFSTNFIFCELVSANNSATFLNK